jgi:UDPglucose 6-dehydrogenase
MSISIIGYGWVGKAMKSVFTDALVYDPSQGYSKNKKQAYSADLQFICVPTPNNKDGSLDSSVVEEIVRDSEAGVICLRSTVMPGTTDMLKKKYKKRLVYQPEYLGETPSHPLLVQKDRKFIILGGDRDDTRKIINAYTGVFNANISIRQVTALEAEVIKLSENRSIAFKVAECQELFDVCEQSGVDYYTIREGVYGDDPRMNLWWTFVYPEKRGMQSKCLPKDVLAWQAWAESSGYSPQITAAILQKNIDWVSQDV